EAGDADFDEGIKFVEAGDDFLGVAQVGGGVKIHAALLARVLDQDFLPLFGRFGIERGEIFLHRRAGRGARQKDQTQKKEPQRPGPPRFSGFHGISYFWPASRRARQIFSGVSGRVLMRAPVHQYTALAIAGATGMMPPSPKPLAP